MTQINAEGLTSLNASGGSGIAQCNPFNKKLRFLFRIPLGLHYLCWRKSPLRRNEGGMDFIFFEGGKKITRKSAYNMKLLNVKWKGHPILGDLELDFVNPKTGKAYDTIVLAGENGSGKTTVLHTLNDFLCVGPINIFEYIDYDINGTSYRVVPQERSNRFFDIWNNDKNKVEVGRRVDIFQDDEDAEKDPRYYGCVFTRGAINYKTNKIEKSSSSDVDKEKHDRGNDDSGTPLKQLLVDMEEIYNEEHRLWYEGQLDKDKRVDDSEVYKKSKIRRFKEAFNNFFDNIKYEGLETGEEKNIIFKKEGKKITIDSLSTGEKQIVFRGAQLLRNIKTMDGGVAMIDEPEISMHPKWQKKILNYYRNLFNTEGNQEVQLFFATHSEYVVSSALQDKDNTLVIVLRQNNGKVEKETITAPKCLPTITSAEVNYLAFAIPTVDYHQQLYSAIQQENNITSVKACDEYIANHSKYNAAIHNVPSSHNNTTYETVCTYVRNRIDHQDIGDYIDEQLALSIELMREILIADKPKGSN